MKRFEGFDRASSSLRSLVHGVIDIEIRPCARREGVPSIAEQPRLREILLNAMQMKLVRHVGNQQAGRLVHCGETLRTIGQDTLTFV